jgi:uncharacterized protein YecT (DUF1311 family)
MPLASLLINRAAVAAATIVVAVSSDCVLAQASASNMEASYSAAFRHCMASGDAADGVTSAMMNCLGAENEVQDKRLNRTYKLVMDRSDPAQKDALRKSERAWIAQREATCRTQSDELGGGTASALAYSNCFLDETIRRTDWLKAR